MTTRIDAPSEGPPRQAHEDEPLQASLKRWEFAGAVVFLMLVVAFPLYKAVETTRRGEALRARQVALVQTGHQLWGLDCASCHGDNGQGVDAPALNSKQFLTAIGDEQMHRIVAAGITGTEMPSWWDEFGGPLTDDQIAAVVAYLRSWAGTAPDRPDWRNPGASPTPSG
jgi:mono/diheme cytochrome c family protein